MIDVFLQEQEPDYFHYLLSVMGKTFAEVIKVGEMVENGIKSGKIVSQASLEATTQVLQNGSGNIGGKKRREDVAAIVSAPRTHVQGNSSQHYFPSQAPQYSVPYTPYHVFNAQPIVPPSYPQWHAPTPQNHPPPHKFIEILLEFLSVLDHNTKREMALKMSSLLLGSRMLACSKN